MISNICNALGKRNTFQKFTAKERVFLYLRYSIRDDHRVCCGSEPIHTVCCTVDILRQSNFFLVTHISQQLILTIAQSKQEVIFCLNIYFIGVVSINNIPFRVLDNLRVIGKMSVIFASES